MIFTLSQVEAVGTCILSQHNMSISIFGEGILLSLEKRLTELNTYFLNSRLPINF